MSRLLHMLERGLVSGSVLDAAVAEVIVESIANADPENARTWYTSLGKLTLYEIVRVHLAVSDVVGSDGDNEKLSSAATVAWALSLASNCFLDEVRMFSMEDVRRRSYGVCRVEVLDLISPRVAGGSEELME